MKNTLTTLLLIFILSSCSSDDKTKVISEIDKLPPATEIGKNTFGCLLDGKAFTPDKSNNSLQCSYEFIDGEYYFYLRGSKYIDSQYNSVYLVSKKKQIIQDQTFELSEDIDYNLFGAWSFGLSPYITDIQNIGKLQITKLTNQIVSGTFYFDIIDEQGNLHQIREGRFDMEYSN